MGSERKVTDEASKSQTDGRPVILLTGFGPFANYKENPAWLALKELEKRANDDLPTSKISFVFRLIPVEYDSVIGTMPSWWNELKPQAIIHVGTGLADGSLYIEKRAYNQGYCWKDIGGQVPCNNCCSDKAPPYIESEFDVDSIVEAINSKLDNVQGLQPAKPSTNAGRYLCSFIYYHSLHGYSRRTLFVHVPPIDDHDGVTAENLARGLKLVVLEIIKQLGLTISDSISA